MSRQRSKPCYVLAANSLAWNTVRVRGLRGHGLGPLGPAVTEVRDVGWKEHRPVPLQEQSRLARQCWNVQQVEPAPHEPGHEAGDPDAVDFCHRLVVAHRAELTLRAVVKRAGGLSLELQDDVRRKLL